jgi:hypothetical protein
MANNRIPAHVEGRSGGRSTAPGVPGARQAHPPHPAQVCTPVVLGAEVKDEQTRRFQLAAWLLEGHNRLGAQRAHSALMLVLGNIVLMALVVLLAFLTLGSHPDWWLLLVVAILTLTCVSVSTLFALLAGASLQVGGDSAAMEAGLFFQSGQMPMLSAAQFSERFHRATRQQMVEGAGAELYAQRRRRARQERWFKWALAALALAIVLFTLSVVGVLVGLAW